MRFPFKLYQFAVAAFLCSAIPLRSQAQDSPEIENLAKQTVARIAKSQTKRVFIGRFSNCLVDTQLCESLDSRLRALLEAAVPDVKFSSREDAVPLLESHKFLSIDSYNDSIVRKVVKDLGVDAVIVENLVWKPAYYELSAKIIDVATNKELRSYSFRLFKAANDKDETPIFFRDSADGPFLIIQRGDPNRFPPFKYPVCEKCPDPIYSKEARDKGVEGTVTFMVTISQQGLATQIALIESIDPGLAESAFHTLLDWRFQPAIALDGKPIPVRFPIQCTFRLTHK